MSGRLPSTGRPAGPARGPLAGPRRRTLLAAGAAAAATGPVWSAVPAGLPALKRGFNLAHWFEYDRSQAVTPAELQGLARLGLDHVRVPLDPLACGWRLEQPAMLPFIGELQQAVDAARAAGLATVVDLHLRPEHKAAVEADSTLEPVVAELWSRMAGALADRPEASLAFELFNEPQYYGVQGLRWPGLQRRLLAAVRSRAPRHLVLLSGARGGSLEGLQALRPEADPRVAYTFHFYEPFVFTHQGLPWLDDRWTAAGSRRDVLYPARLHRDRPPTTLRPHPKAQAEWADYLARDWGPAAVQQTFDQAAAWARRHGVAVVCNEFGAIRAQVDPASRYRWMSDVRLAAEQRGIGWTVWDYTHIFGLTAQSGQPGHVGRRQLDAAAISALGLQTPATAVAGGRG